MFYVLKVHQPSLAAGLTLLYSMWSLLYILYEAGNVSHV